MRTSSTTEKIDPSQRYLSQFTIHSCRYIRDVHLLEGVAFLLGFWFAEANYLASLSPNSSN